MKRFRNDDACRLFKGQQVRRLPADIQRRARMRLQRVVGGNGTHPTFGVPPSHQLKALRGDRAGQYSIRANDQWRVCFLWTEQGAMGIEVTDCH